MNLNDITFLPARLSTGYRDKAGWPPGKLLLQTIGLTLIFLVATGGWIWLVFKALNLFTGPFVSSVSLLTVGAPFFAALPSFLYAFLCFWLAARSDGKTLSQLQSGWLLKASAIIGVAGASLGFIIAVLALPQFAYSAIPNWLLVTHALLIAAIFLPFLTLVLSTPFATELEAAEPFAALWSASTRFLHTRYLLVMSLVLLLLIGASYLTAFTALIILLPFLLFQFLYIRLTSGREWLTTEEKFETNSDGVTPGASKSSRTAKKKASRASTRR